jgi:hypothetical protein
MKKTYFADHRQIIFVLEIFRAEYMLTIPQFHLQLRHPTTNVQAPAIFRNATQPEINRQTATTSKQTERLKLQIRRRFTGKPNPLTITNLSTFQATSSAHPPHLPT